MFPIVCLFNCFELPNMYEKKLELHQCNQILIMDIDKDIGNGAQVNRRTMQKMKANPVTNEERLRVHREKKQKYWQRVKESIATATAANLVTEQNDDSAFSQAHIRSRSIQKVAKTLPKNPRKRKEVISALPNKFKLRIKPTLSKAGRPKNESTGREKE